jgi:hypothetical protein
MTARHAETHPTPRKSLPNPDPTRPHRHRHPAAGTKKVGTAATTRRPHHNVDRDATPKVATFAARSALPRRLTDAQPE